MPRKPKQDPHRVEYRDENGTLLAAVTMPNPVRFVVEDEHDQIHIERTALGGDFVTKHLTRATDKKKPVWAPAKTSCVDAIRRLNAVLDQVGAPCGTIR